ncbi:MAG: DUF2384 domain-containing protein [Gemmataceae bacterium]|nr:DUF2384 domain-containing protein [Gemmataceae bacterium]
MNPAVLSPSAVLGLKETEPSAVHQSILKGLPFSALQRFEEQSRLSGAEIGRLIRVPASTLARRRKAHRLDPDESDRLYRLAMVFARAAELFEGDAEAARRWLTGPVRGLGYQVPLDLAGTEAGAKMVLDIIGRLEHGVFT